MRKMLFSCPVCGVHIGFFRKQSIGYEPYFCLACGAKIFIRIKYILLEIFCMFFLWWMAFFSSHYSLILLLLGFVVAVVLRCYSPLDYKTVA